MQVGTLKNMQEAINMNPSQLVQYKRRLRNGCPGTITITKTLGPHIIIESNMDIYDRSFTSYSLLHQFVNYPTFHLKRTLNKTGKQLLKLNLNKCDILY